MIINITQVKTGDWKETHSVVRPSSAGHSPLQVINVAERAKCVFLILPEHTLQLWLLCTYQYTEIGI